MEKPAFQLEVFHKDDLNVPETQPEDGIVRPVHEDDKLYIEVGERFIGRITVHVRQGAVVRQFISYKRGKRAKKIPIGTAGDYADGEMVIVLHCFVEYGEGSEAGDGTVCWFKPYIHRWYIRHPAGQTGLRPLPNPSEIEKLTEELARLRKQVQTKEVLAEKQKVERSVEELRAEIEEQRKQETRKTAELQKLTQAVTAAGERIRVLDEENGRLSAQVREKEQKSADLNSECKAQDTKITELEEKKKTLDARRGALKPVEDEAAEVEKLEAECEKKRKEVETRRNRLVELTGESDDLDRRLSVAEDQAKKLASLQQALESARKEYDRGNREFIEAILQTLEDRKTIHGDIGTLRSSLKKLGTWDNLSEEIRIRIGALRTKLEALTEESRILEWDAVQDSENE